MATLPDEVTQWYGISRPVTPESNDFASPVTVFGCRARHLIRGQRFMTNMDGYKELHEMTDEELPDLPAVRIAVLLRTGERWLIHDGRPVLPVSPYVEQWARKQQS